jgi:hypothetical protein
MRFLLGSAAGSTGDDFGFGSLVSTAPLAARLKKRERFRAVDFSAACLVIHRRRALGPGPGLV